MDKLTTTLEEIEEHGCERTVPGEEEAEGADARAASAGEEASAGEAGE